MSLATPVMRMAGTRLASTIARRAAEKTPYGAMEALRDAARLKGPADAAMRIGPDLMFGAMGAMGPGGVGAGVLDALTGSAASYGGDVLGAAAGAGLAKAFGASPRAGAQMGQMAGGMAGNMASMFIPNPIRNSAYEKEQLNYEQQLLAQASPSRSAPADTGQAMEGRIMGLASQYGVDPDDPLTRLYLSQM